MYHVSAQGIDERMINVHYYYKKQSRKQLNDVQSDARLLSDDNLREFLIQHERFGFVCLFCLVFCFQFYVCLFVFQSQSNFSTLLSGLRNGANLTPLSSGTGCRMSEFTASLHVFSPLLDSVRCLKIWIGL